MRTYSNSRTEATITDWPSGGRRVTATFAVSIDPKRGQRVTRITIDPKSGRTNAPKMTVYCPRWRIVDGDDGRTYLIAMTEFRYISVMRGDMQIEEETVFPDNPRYAELRKLLTD